MRYPEKKLILKRIGLNNPTEVEYGSKILVTNQLGVSELCKLWRRYFNLPEFKIIPLYVVNERDFYSMMRRTLPSVKSLNELFAECGFDLQLLENHRDIVSEWKLYRKEDVQEKAGLNLYLVHEKDSKEGCVVAAATTGRAKSLALRELWGDYLDLRVNLIRKNTSLRVPQVVHNTDNQIIDTYRLRDLYTP